MTRLVLASRSSIRIKLLRDVGLAFDIDAADLDEDAIGRSVANPAARAARLARAKAQAVSARQPGALVIGADQVGVLDDNSFLEKPRDTADHEAMLVRMSGRTHMFFPTAVLVQDGDTVAEVAETVRVTFRKFSQATAIGYVQTGEGRGSCGGYESEHKGAQLIDKIEGSAHAVLGLPLLPLLDALRKAAPDLRGLL